MKKWILVLALALVVSVGGLAVVPNIVRSSVPAIYYITPVVKTYVNMVNCTGTIESENVYRVYTSGAIVPGEIPVSLGDMVSEGQLLLEVDEDATAWLSQNPVSDAMEQLTDGIGSQQPSIDLSAILSGYGLSDLLGGGLDLGQLAGSVGAEADGGSPESVAVLSGPDAKKITAPASGIVTEIGAVTGSPIMAGKAVFTLQDVKSYKVTAAVSESDISKIQIGDRAVIRGTGFPGASFEGYVSMIHPTARKTLTGTTADTVVDVEIKLEKPNNKLKPGFSAKVEIAGGQSYELVTLPYEVIRQDEHNNEFIYLYENGKLKKAPVVTGKELTSEVEVVEGIGVDSIVVYNPDDIQEEGSTVNIRGRAEIA